MEGLFVDGIDRHLRRAKQTRIVKRPDLYDNQRQTRSSRRQMRSAFTAKFARHGAFEIGTREFARFASGVAKALRIHEHKHVRRAAADVLAFAAMALRLKERWPHSEFCRNSIRPRISWLTSEYSDFSTSQKGQTSFFRRVPNGPTQIVGPGTNRSLLTPNVCEQTRPPDPRMLRKNY